MAKLDLVQESPSREWRESFLRRCGPGVLGGITFPDWLRLLRHPELRIDWPRWLRVVTLTTQSLKNSLLKSVERRRYHTLIEQVPIRPPLFVLGHWRSGTTFLHELLAQDRRFAFPNSYQVSFPHSFLTSEATDTRWLSLFIPKCRPMDNVALSLASPQEDEFALCAATQLSPCMAWVFPQQKERFEKYLSFRGVSSEELTQWRNAFLYFMKKVQFRAGDRPLLLKSPPHTARVGLLLELFPKAKFVHIHRNPYRVFNSSHHAFRIMFEWHGLQQPGRDGLDEWILRQYDQMYASFFEERNLIPAGNFHEMEFEQLETDPLGQMRKLYEALSLPEFRVAEPALREYMDSLKGFRKNRLDKLAPDLAQCIRQRWKRCFEEWTYEEP